MNAALKQSKATIRDFMRNHYTDERLAMLLAHAQEGRLAYDSCCCFVGVVTAEHSLNGYGQHGVGGKHGKIYWFEFARDVPLAFAAERAFLDLGGASPFEGDDIRRARLIPVIRAEMKRRATADDFNEGGDPGDEHVEPAQKVGR